MADDNHEVALLARRHSAVIEEPPIDVVDRLSIYEVTRVPTFGNEVRFAGALRNRTTGETAAESATVLSLPA